MTCLELVNKFVITSSDDGTVKAWDVTTGEYIRDLISLDSGGNGKIKATIQNLILLFIISIIHVLINLGLVYN